MIHAKKSNRKAAKKDELLVRSFAFLLQQHLQTEVLCAELFWAGKYGPVETHPCSIVTVHPYAPGGTRRLVLNARNPLVLDLAAAAAAVGSQRDNKAASAALEMGASLLWINTWPTALDVSCGAVAWKTSPGLICGSHWNLLAPNPHEIVEPLTLSGKKMSSFPALAIWPRRIQHIQIKEDPSGKGPPTKHVFYLGEKWQRREELLWREWNARKKSEKTILGFTPKRRWTPTLSLDGTTPTSTQSTVKLATTKFRFVTYAPSLPVLLLAQYLQQPTSSDHPDKLVVPRIEATSAAAMALLSCDKLFCLSLFFGVPLMDRTRTWEGALPVNFVVPPTPTAEEVQDYVSDLCVSLDDPVAALDATMMNRAKSIWIQALEDNKDVIVCWSGGMDSTAALVSLLRTCSESNLHRLMVLMDDVSLRENPSFFEAKIKGSLKVLQRNGRILSEIAQSYGSRAILVTGELGDQLFGSDRCGIAFPSDPPTDTLTPYEQQYLANMTLGEMNHEDIHLDETWENALLPLLEDQGLLGEGAQSWKDFFAPQLAQAPFQIRTLYDLLWWLNFSCKWQTVSLRCLHDGGGYRPPTSTPAGHTHPHLTGSITHFYQDRQLECWACVPEFHEAKFPELSNWKSYKQPLKTIIHAFHGDDDYFQNKTKVGSLTFDLEGSRKDCVESCLGLVLTEDSGVQELRSGLTSIAELRETDWNHFTLKDGASVNGVEDMLEPWIMESDKSKPLIKTPSVVVDPWSCNDDGSTAADVQLPFVVASQFAEQDERQRRTMNPVTATTLHGKCSALLPPEIVAGKTVLDLGACLGAMCHWSLFHGAKHVVGVEPQQNFCHRMQTLLSSARDTWNRDNDESDESSEEPFSVVCMGAREFLSRCSDDEFDVVVCAGVLHCFQDPISIIIEMARVAKTVCIESVHATFHVSGFQQLESAISTSTGLLELAPSANVNKAGEDTSFTGLSVVPSEVLITNILSAVGYDVVRVRLMPHPTKNDEVLTYTGNRRCQASPVRFFLRCQRRSGQAVAQMRTLEECVKTGVGNELRWGLSRNRYWTNYTTGMNETVHSPPTEAAKKSWEFDEEVAARFFREARTHIPDYVDVVCSCLDAIATHFGRDRLGSLRAVDVGCATGYTVLEMLKRGIGCVEGYDLSQSMLDVAKENVLSSKDLPQKSACNLFLARDAVTLPPELGNESLDVAVANWTLHFIVDAEHRLRYMSELFSALKPGGILLLTEKTDQDENTMNMYYEWKAAQGVSWEEIRSKKAQLVGVLETKPPSWYFDALLRCGYENVTILRAKFGFVTFVCYKPFAQETLALTAEVDPFVSWIDVDTTAHSVAYDGSEDPNPYLLSAWGMNSQKAMIEEAAVGAASFGFVQSGEAVLSRELGNGRVMNYTLIEGMYFACPGRFRIEGGSGFISSVPNATHLPLFGVGGPLEEEDGELVGRLPYIDGCTDTLLIPPVVKGAPCLNHLHFPSGVAQTQHTHPSGRTGIVVRGRGCCVTVDPERHTVVKTSLLPGMVFCIPTNAPHAFETSDDEVLDVVAFHPDSDFGPTPTDHPMVNRTMVDGLSASLLPSIQTSSGG